MLPTNPWFENDNKKDKKTDKKVTMLAKTDIMAQSYPIDVCTDSNHARYFMEFRVHFAVAEREGF